MLKDNTKSNQYEYHINGSFARIEYIKIPGKIFLTHTEVPKELEGQGLGTKMLIAVLKDIKNSEQSLVALCPFVIAFLRKNPEWMKLENRNKFKNGKGD